MQANLCILVQYWPQDKLLSWMRYKFLKSWYFSNNTWIIQSWWWSQGRTFVYRLYRSQCLRGKTLESNHPNLNHSSILYQVSIHSPDDKFPICYMRIKWVSTLKGNFKVKPCEVLSCNINGDLINISNFKNKQVELKWSNESFPSIFLKVENYLYLSSWLLCSKN